MTSLVHSTHNRSIRHRTTLTNDFETSKIAPEIKPVHVNILHSCPRRTDPAELDDPVKLVLVSLANHFNTTISEIPHPARDTQLPGQVVNLATKENALDLSRNQ